MEKEKSLEQQAYENTEKALGPVAIWSANDKWQTWQDHYYTELRRLRNSKL